MQKRRLQSVSTAGWALVLSWLLLAGAPAVAQPDDDAGTADTGQEVEQASGQTDPQEQNEDAPVTDQPGGIEAASQSVDEEGDEDDEDRERGPAGPSGRFIPSEQISQDLGVSFPADI